MSFVLKLSWQNDENHNIYGHKSVLLVVAQQQQQQFSLLKWKKNIDKHPQPNTW